MFLATWQPPATRLPLAQDLQEVSQTQLSVVETTHSIATQSTIDLQPVTMYQPDSPQDTNPSNTSNLSNLSNILTNTNENESNNPVPNPNDNTPVANPPTENNNTQQPNEVVPHEETTPDNLEPEHEEVFDPQSIVRDIVEDDQNGRNLRLCEEYKQAKTNLIGLQVQTSAGLTWMARDDVLHAEVESVDNTVVGVRNFDFNNKRMKTSRGLARINFLDLLIHLWPGDW